MKVKKLMNGNILTQEIESAKSASVMIVPKSSTAFKRLKVVQAAEDLGIVEGDIVRVPDRAGSPLSIELQNFFVINIQEVILIE